jgi:phage terminase large subunit-like protein
MTTRSPTSKPEAFATIANRYARQVVAGRVVAGELVQAACRRHLADLKRAANSAYPYHFDVARAERICRFVEGLPHVKGEWARQGRRIVLEAWQVFALCCAFGWLQRSTGRRRFRRVYLEVGRKNAKSTLSAGIGLYGLTADDEPGAEVYALATTREQAGIVWKDARQMVRASRGLRKRFNVRGGAKAIFVPGTNSTFQALPRSPRDGLNPHIAIVDEFHEHQTPEAYDAMYAGQGARTQPLMWVVTTAGTNRAGPCYAMRGYGVSVLQGVIKDDSLLVLIYTLDKGDDVFDSRVWAKANPNLGVSVSYEQLEEAANEAKDNPVRMATLSAKRMNLWVSSFQAWMDMLKWDGCSTRGMVLDAFNGRSCTIALDLASKIDVAAMVLVFPDVDGGLSIFGRYYLPEEAVRAYAQTSLAHFAAWEADGWITLTPGNVIDFEYIKNDLREFRAQFDVREIVFDPWQATQLATEMLNEGAPMVELPNIVKYISPAMKEIMAMVVSRKLRHGGDPVLAWMASNVVARMDAKENIYPRKDAPEKKIDGMVALFMATARVMLTRADAGGFDDFISNPVSG